VALHKKNIAAVLMKYAFSFRIGKKILDALAFCRRFSFLGIFERLRFILSF
jgi:hypothetical protein